jgi:xanthine dehydrogenase YagR molybdenum-binding subunit
VTSARTERVTCVGRSEQWIGQPLDRLDGPAKVTGAARYSAEYPQDHLAHVALVHATITRGRITSIDVAAASGLAGVVAVITHENAPRMKRTSAQNPARGNLSSSATSVTYLNTDEIHWNGQPVAVVVAETVDIAHHAVSLVRVGYDTAPATVDFEAELGRAKKQPGNPITPPHANQGDAEAALASARFAVDPAVHHADAPPQRDRTPHHHRHMVG